MRPVGRGEALGVHVGLAVGGRVPLLGHCKVDKHLRRQRSGVGGSRSAALPGAMQHATLGHVQQPWERQRSWRQVDRQNGSASTEADGWVGCAALPLPLMLHVLCECDSSSAVARV